MKHLIVSSTSKSVLLLNHVDFKDAWWSNFESFLPLEWARWVSAHSLQNLV